MTIKAIQDHVLVTDMEFKERITQTGLILPSDDETSAGIRPRWGRVIAIGKDQEDVKVGQWIMVEHGRWTRGVEIEDQVVRRVDNDDILVVSDKQVQDDTMAGEEVVVDQYARDINSIY